MISGLKIFFHYLSDIYLKFNPWKIITLWENETTKGISFSIVNVLTSLVVRGGPFSKTVQ